MAIHAPDLAMWICEVCATPYPTEREADLCTPLFMIEDKYGEASVPVPPAAVMREYEWRGEPGSAAATGGLIYNRESYFR
jgi:hypothetical protein